MGFERFELEAGKDGELSRCTVPLDALAERDVDAHAMVVRPGTYVVRVARHASDEGIRIRVTVGGRTT